MGVPEAHAASQRLAAITDMSIEIVFFLCMAMVSPMLFGFQFCISLNKNPCRRTGEGLSCLCLSFATTSFPRSTPVADRGGRPGSGTVVLGKGKVYCTSPLQVDTVIHTVAGQLRTPFAIGKSGKHYRFRLYACPSGGTGTSVQNIRLL